MMCEEFNKLIKKIRIIIHRISALSSLVEHKIVICLFEKFITRSKEQWLENESYLLSEFLQRVKAIESQLQEKMSIDWIYIQNDMLAQKVTSTLN